MYSRSPMTCYRKACISAFSMLAMLLPVSVAAEDTSTAVDTDKVQSKSEKPAQSEKASASAESNGSEKTETSAQAPQSAQSPQSTPSGTPDSQQSTPPKQPLSPQSAQPGQPGQPSPTTTANTSQSSVPPSDGIKRPPVWHRLYTRLSGSMCYACLKDLQESVAKLPGVAKIKVERGPQSFYQPVSPDISSWAQAAIVYDSEQLDFEILRASIKQNGYHPYRMQDRLLERDPEDRDLKM